VLIGLVGVRAGRPQADSIAALFVAALVLVAAARLMRRNVDVLMDRAPADAEEAARLAIAGIEPPIQLRRLRMRSAAGRHFADVVIAVSPSAAVGQGHAAADAVEAAVERALPETDVVVHVEPTDEDALTRELAYAAALKVRRVREIHNVAVLHIDGRTEVSLHLKLPGESSLEEAHRAATEVERAIADALPGVDAVRTHLEPLGEETEGRAPPRGEVAADADAVTRVALEQTGRLPRELRFLQTDDGLLVFLTLGLDSSLPLAEAHARASEIEERIRRDVPGVAEIIVHTEP
jgi:divalent metal cation (Fe/Co/Zn/Cd) transporter